MRSHITPKTMQCIKIFGFLSEKWISLVGKKLPYFSNSYLADAGKNVSKIFEYL
jgi:hypothetical protein